MQLRTLHFILGILGVGCFLFGQTPTHSARVLLPVVLVEPVHGAHGSIWKTELRITNSGVAPMTIRGPLVPCQFICPPAETPPGITYEGLGPGGTPNGIQGSFLIIENGAVGELAINLRAYDLSRTDRSFGTELPVVADSEFYTKAFDLTNVPVQDSFRITLRIYSAATLPESVAVSMWGIDTTLTDPLPPALPDPFLGRAVLHFTVPPMDVASEFYPRYVQLSDLTAIGHLQGYDRVRLRIEPAEGDRVWGFVSVTHDETQHVTTISPPEGK